MISRLRFILPLLLCLLAPALGFAQGNVPYRTKLIYGPSDGPISVPKITVCVQGSDLTKLPCQGLATIYSDAAGDAQANPFFGDKYGNVVFYGPPGTEYVVSVTAPLSPGYSWIVDLDDLNAILSGNNLWTGAQSFKGTPPPFYVATAGNGGSDSNDCLSATVSGGHGPCLTVQHACLVAMSYDIGGANVTVNIGTGSFAGVELAGFLRGSPLAGFGAFLILNGNGAANTTLTGYNSALVISTDSGLLLQIQNMTVSVAANQVGLWYEGPGTNLTVGSGVTITGAASTSIGIQGEQLAYAAFGADVTFSGTFGTLINLGGLAYFDNGHKLTCSGLSMTQFISLVGGSYAQFDTSASFSGCGGIVGIPYNLFDNSSINNGTTAFPGTSLGQVQTGGRYRPTPTETINGSPSGLGSGGTATITRSGSHGGIITLTTGSGPSPTGNIAINWAELQLTAFGAPVACIAAPTNGATAWATGATAAVFSNTTSLLQITWSNNGNNLTGSTSYAINYVCDGD